MKTVLGERAAPRGQRTEPEPAAEASPKKAKPRRGDNLTVERHEVRVLTSTSGGIRIEPTFVADD